MCDIIQVKFGYVDTMKNKFLFLIITFTLIFNTAYASELLTLDKCINIALESNGEVIKAQQKIIAKEKKLFQANSKRLPNVSLTGGFGEAFQDPATAVMNGSPIDFGIAEPLRTSEISLNLIHPLYLGGKLLNSIKVAEKLLEIAEINLKKIKQDIKFKATDAYYSVVKAQRYLDLMKESHENAKIQLDHTKRLRDRGLVKNTDVLRAEIQVLNYKQKEAKAENSLEFVKNNLYNILGGVTAEDFEVPDHDLKYSSDSKNLTDLGAFLSEAYLTRSELKQVEIRKQIYENNISIARSERLPHFSVRGLYGLKNSEYTASSIKYDQKMWNIFVTGSLTLFNGFETQNKIDEIRADLKAIEVEENSLKRMIRMEVRKAFRDINEATDRLESAKRTVELAEENLNEIRLKYDRGISTDIEMTDAEILVTESKVSSLNALVNYRISMARMNRIVGKEIFKRI